MATYNSDVVIAGGGLAGLGLASQLIEKRPDLSITVVERNRFPVHNTTAKVGESTVEIASHYLCDTLKLDEHFKNQHLQKFGLRCYFGTPQKDFSDYDELGASQRFKLPTYQLERGVLENHLYHRLVRQGVQFQQGVSVQSVAVARHNHQLHIVDDSNAKHTLKSRWLVDCAGRANLVKNHLQLHKPSNHKGNAVWFRVDKTLKIDEWSNNSQWRDRLVTKDRRWLSTNHLMGPGYWVWIIPLASGATSIGVVMDDQAFESAQLTDYDRALLWLSRNHPQCAEALADAKPLDYVVLTDYSYNCKQVFSEDGWGLSGEAGVFADPFYSPGSDFIALSNEILAHLITKDCSGQSITFDTKVLEIFFSGFFNNTISLYAGEYGGFGDRVMMSVKLVWDYCFYWGVLALIYYKNKLTDIAALRDLNHQLLETIELNASMQARLRERAQQRLVLPTTGAFIDQYPIPVLQHFIGQLDDPSVTLEQAIPKTLEIFKQISPMLANLLSDQPSREITELERELLGDFRHSVLS